MNWWKSRTAQAISPVADGSERRRAPRIGGRFKVRYSGADANKIVIGYGMITDLSRHGFGIEGARGLKRGMELALFLQMPDDDETICIPAGDRLVDQREAVWRADPRRFPATGQLAEPPVAGVRAGITRVWQDAWR